MDYLEENENEHHAQYPNVPWQRFRASIQARMDAAMMELHDMSKDDLLNIIDTAKQLKLPHGARIALIEAATSWDPDIAELILKGTDHANPKFASQPQASAIIKAARQAGLDAYKLADMAEYLGYTETQLGITKPKVSRHALAQIEKAARYAGLAEDSIEAMLYELNPVDEFIVQRKTRT